MASRFPDTKQPQEKPPTKGTVPIAAGSTNVWMPALFANMWKSTSARISGHWTPAMDEG